MTIQGCNVSQSDEEPLLDIAHGDEARSRHLRESLKTLRDRVPDERFQHLIDGVLTGKSSVRELATSEIFGQAVAPLAQQSVDRMHEMTDEEKRDITEKSQQDLDDLNREMSNRGKLGSGSAASQDGEDDGDDEDFSDGSFLQPVK